MYSCTYHQTVQCEWNLLKAAANKRKHGVDFADAATVLYDVLAVTIRDEASDEDRFVTLDADAQGRLLVVVYILKRR